MDILLKRGSRNAIENYTGNSGELAIDTDHYTLNYYDGSVKGGHQIVTEKNRPIKLGTDFNGKTLKDLKQKILEIFDCPGYNQKAFSISINASFVSNWNNKNDDFAIQDGKTWTFILLTEVNGYQNHYFQFLATTYSSMNITNDMLSDSAVIWSGDCWNGEFGLLTRINSSIMNWSNNLWCRQYTDGFNFVGGKIVCNGSTKTITLPVSFINSNYTITTGSVDNSSCLISNKTTTSFDIKSSGTLEFMIYGH